MSEALPDKSGYCCGISVRIGRPPGRSASPYGRIFPQFTLEREYPLDGGYLLTA